MTFAPKHLIALLLLATTPVAASVQAQIPAQYGALHIAIPADERDSVPSRPDSARSKPTPRAPESAKHYWAHMALGFGASILAHEAGHVGASLIMGAHPHFGLDRGRPTVYSGINVYKDPYKQFMFSSAGLNVQAILDEAILDVPHNQGSSFERGILLGGITTAYFYATIGRNASNSDITYMARTSNLSKTSASLIYAGLATVHAIRIHRNHHYANFFIRPNRTTGGMNVGVSILPDSH